MISDNLKCIYIHIPKVAGTSIKYALSKHTRHPSVICEYVNRAMRQIRNKNSFQHYNYGLPEHAKALDYKNNIKSYEEYFSFTFVRNPYDWAVSNYEYVKQTKHHPRHKLVKGISFQDFVDLYPYTGTYQYNFLTDEDGDVIVDFIGKYENIQDDIHTIGNSLGIEITLPRKNTTVRKNWKKYYDRETAELVRSKFKYDFEYFGYSTQYY